MSDIILEMRGITKEFPGVKALDNVNLKVQRGEIHALVGENGAGKSTLMNILSGVYPFGTYSGDILFDDKVCEFRNISQSEETGVVIVHQELALLSNLSIAENLFLGNEIAEKGVINWDKATKEANELLLKVGLVDNPKTLVGDIGVGKQQLVEIARALSKECKLLILDEPTAALNETDSAHLLQLIKELQKNGITCVIISHKLNEVISVADQITVLRDGVVVDNLVSDETVSEERIIRSMVGRKLTDRYPRRERNIGDVRFEVRNWNVSHPLDVSRKVSDEVSFNIRKGEVVGIAGLMGAGRTELAMSIFGQSYGQRITGEVYKDGELIKVKTVSDAINNGIAYLSEDRKEYGLVQMLSVLENITLADLQQVSKYAVVNDNKQLVEANKYAENLNIKYSNILQSASSLSGGNQQKVVVAKWLFSNSDILLLDEPTRGIDVGAKFDLYEIINGLAGEGKAILMISSELPELLGMCDRIYIMSKGKIKGVLPIEEASQEAIMQQLV